MELPVHNLVSELVLCMPIDAAQLRVQFDKAVVAKGLVVALL